MAAPSRGCPFAAHPRRPDVRPSCYSRSLAAPRPTGAAIPTRSLVRLLPGFSHSADDGEQAHCRLQSARCPHASKLRAALHTSDPARQTRAAHNCHKCLKCPNAVKRKSAQAARRLRGAPRAARNCMSRPHLCRIPCVRRSAAHSPPALVSRCALPDSCPTRAVTPSVRLFFPNRPGVTMFVRKHRVTTDLPLASAFPPAIIPP